MMVWDKWTEISIFHWFIIYEIFTGNIAFIILGALHLLFPPGRAIFYKINLEVILIIFVAVLGRHKTIKILDNQLGFEFEIIEMLSTQALFVTRSICMEIKKENG